MTSMTVHRVETVKVERTEWEAIAWTTIKVTDTDGMVAEITLHHATTAAPLITQG